MRLSLAAVWRVCWLAATASLLGLSVGGAGASGIGISDSIASRPWGSAGTVAVLDSMNRVTQHGLGRADQGGAYRLRASNRSFRVADGRAWIQTGRGAESEAFLPATSLADTDVAMKFRIRSGVPRRGYSAVTLGARQSTGGAGYRAVVRVSSAGVVRVKIQRTRSGRRTPLAMTRWVRVRGVSASGWAKVRLRVTGTGLVLVQARVWSGEEPAGWTASARDTGSARRTSGRISFGAVVSPHGPRVAEVGIDDLAATTVQSASSKNKVGAPSPNPGPTRTPSPSFKPSSNPTSSAAPTPSETSSRTPTPWASQMPRASESPSATPRPSASQTGTLPTPPPANEVPRGVLTVGGRGSLWAAFDASESTDADGHIVAWDWDFGDGSTGSGSRITHRYRNPGEYAVSLRVTDERGAMGLVSRRMKVAWPDSSSAGVQPGSPLIPVLHDVVVTTPGTVIDGQDIYGWVWVRAANVTIRNSIIRGGNAPVQYDASGKALAQGNRALLDVTSPAATGLLVEDTTIVPRYPSVLIDNVRGSNFTLRRVDAWGGVDGIKIHGIGNVRIEDSYIHDMHMFKFDPYQNDGSHNDGIQILSGKGIVVTGSSVGTGATASGESKPGRCNWGDPAVLDQVCAPRNAAVQVTQGNVNPAAGRPAVTDLVLSGNLFDGGWGNYTLNFNPAPLSSLSGIVVVDNTFGRGYRLGPALAYAGASVAFSGNSWWDLYPGAPSLTWN